jgi:hypothetical protein
MLLLVPLYTNNRGVKMKKVCVILLMLALFGCEEGGGGAGVPVKPPVDGGWGGTNPPDVPPVVEPTGPVEDIKSEGDANAQGGGGDIVLGNET